MYTVESYKKPYARVVNGVDYVSDFLAASLAEGEQIAMTMNLPEMLAELATYRFQVETQGLELAGGLQLVTTRESQGQINNAVADLEAGRIPDTDLKAANGWETMNLEQMRPIAKALAAHVRACFRGERVLMAAINAATTLDKQLKIDIRRDFDQAYQAAYAEVMATA